MIRKCIIGLVTLFALMSVIPLEADDKTPDKAAKSTSTNRSQNEQIIVYYFHSKIRCDACKKTEEQSRNIIERRFAAELKSKLMSFKTVNFDENQNAHYLKDYKLPCPSLVVVYQKGAKDVKWKLLGDTWEHLENLPKFNEYVESEVTKFIKEKK